MMHRILSSWLGIALLLACGAAFLLSWHVLNAASCHFITQTSQTPSGYASPVSFFGGSLLIKGDCNSNSVAVTVGNNEPTTYIYDKSYLWTGSQWQSKTLTGSNKQGAWIPEVATTNLTSSQSPTYYVAYTCEWVNQAWKCGCQNQSCTQNQWQLQIFQTQSGNQGGGGYTGGNGTQECPLKNDLFLNPFNKDSAFHRPIGTGAQYAGESHPVTVAWKNFFNKNPNRGTINQVPPYHHEVHKIQSSDPVRAIAGRNCNNTGPNTGRGSFPVSLRLPASFPEDYNASLPCSENSVTIFDPQTGIGHQFYQFNRDAGASFRANIHIPVDFRGPGHGTKLGDRFGVTATGMAALAGSIRAEEILTPGTPIRHSHALNIPALNHNPTLLGRGIQWPATSPDSFAVQAGNNTGIIPYGALFALPPSINLDSLNLSEPGRRFAQSVRDYGLYISDDGPVTIRATAPLGAKHTALQNDLRKILPMLRMVTNSVSGANATIPAGGTWPGSGSVGTPVGSNGASWPAGGGTPLAPNCAFDA